MSKRNYGFVLNYMATTVGGIGAGRIVKFGSNDGEVALATAATDLSIGVTTDIAAAQNERCDVVRSGVAPVYYGGNVTRGAKLTADSNGAAVAAAPSAGSNVQIIGIAEVSGVSGDLGSVMILPSVMQG